MKALIIEDEQQLISTIVKYLKQKYFVCEKVYSLEEAKDKLQNFFYDCIILDITLPDGNGLSLLKTIKEQKRNEGVIIISAKNSIDDKILGFELGADDYLPKPFHLAELGARINAIVRRKQFYGLQQINVNGLVLDYNAKSAVYNQKKIDLTKSEYDILVFLVANKNKVITKKAIAEHITGDHADMFDNFDFVYTHLKTLKRKLDNSGCINHIKSVYGLGYKFEH
jgi:DNA-binding response OmpR family regulator